MKMSLCTALCAAAITLAAGTASADPGKDESGKGRWRGDYEWGDSERKSKFFTRDGCEVERKWKKGEYESKVKCKPGRYGYDARIITAFAALQEPSPSFISATGSQACGLPLAQIQL